ncbi:hypothetical protein HMPREF9018_0677 [Prevotella amnii CRIS 21A-A]|uniref:GYF domain-containing protein n=1 Tax=Prevotella amnii CRIS 21A-A TaxID=679191 RepID=E1GWV7_9BACT|nr:DUF4359 domain-containing protein [Prevotella amnii]EFN90854.1 hypothetical protein HMPREF9018_0677 [Prevotella amnii CRIS 21A-A]
MEFFISLKNEKIGPYTIKELKERNLDAATLVMSVNDTKWVPAWQVEELRPILEHEANLKTNNIPDELTSKNIQADNTKAEEDFSYVKAKPIYNNATTQEHEPNFQSVKKKKSHGCLIGFISLVVILLILCFTCPSKDDHKKALTDVITQTLDDAKQKLNDDSDLTGIDQTFTTMFLSSIDQVVKSSIDSLLKVNNYGVFSIGKINFAGQEKIVSLGILNHVFTLDKQDIEQEINRRLQAGNNIQKGSKLKQGIKGLIEDGIIPLTKSLKDVIGSTINDLINEGDNNTQEPADSI